MDVKSKLSEIVGAENFSDDPVQLQAYATDFSYYPAGAPNYVVKPSSSEEVAEVIKVLQRKQHARRAVQFQGPFLRRHNSQGGRPGSRPVQNGQDPGNRC